MKDLGANEYMTIVGVAAAAYIVYKVFSTGAKIGDAISETATSAVNTVKKVVAEDINPASDKNIVYSAVNGIGSFFTGDDNFNLGSKAYDWFNGPFDFGQSNAPKSIPVGSTNANFTVDHALNLNQSFEAISKGSNFDVTDPLYYSGYVYTPKGI